MCEVVHGTRQPMAVWMCMLKCSDRTLHVIAVTDDVCSTIALFSLDLYEESF